MKGIVLGAACLVTVASAQTMPPPTAAELRSKFEHRVQQIAGRVDGAVGYAVLDLTSGDRIGHLDRETFPTASAIKLAIVYELFKQEAEGKIRLDETMNNGCIAAAVSARIWACEL